MLDFILHNPLALGVCVLPILWIFIVVHHYGPALVFWSKLAAANFPFIGFIARTKRRPGSVRILNTGQHIQICYGERSLALLFLDALKPRLPPEQWQQVATFLTRSGDSELPGVLRQPPIRKLAKVTIIFIEAYAVSLLVAPKLSAWVTPEQVPAIAFGMGVAFAIGLAMLLTWGGRHARTYEAYRLYMRDFERDPQSGQARPKPIAWTDDQRQDDQAPPFQMGLARLHAPGNPRLIVAAVIGAVLAVLFATGLRYVVFKEEVALQAVQAKELALEFETSAELSPLQATYVKVNRTATEFALVLFFLTFGLGAIMTFTDAKERTALGRGVPELLNLTRNCASREEEAALLVRNHAAVSKLLNRLQREMPPFPRPTIPSIYDVMNYLASAHGASPLQPPQPVAPTEGGPPGSPSSPVNVAQLPARREPQEKLA
jgi:hypothetical protein